MLQELSIKNFAIIDELTVSLEKGLTVLTGETGAGKSIIIDALYLLAGGRGSSEFVRHGEKKAELEGLFILEDQKHPCYVKTAELGIEIEEGMVVLQRDISSNGKSVCRVNGKLVTIGILREIGSSLVDIHGQHEHQELMDESSHIRLLDQFGEKEIARALKNYKEVFSRYDQTKKRITQLSENEQQMAHRLDLIQFQFNEIQKANLKIGEDLELSEEKKKLGNFERLAESMQSAYSALQGEQKSLDWVSLVMGHLETAAELDSELNGALEAVSNSFYALEDATMTIRNHLDMLEFNPERLNEIEARLNEINGLKRKYGSSIEEIAEYSAKIEEEIDAITNRDNHLHNLQKELSSLEKDLSIEADELSALRKKWAKKLTDSIHKELKHLYMEKTVFQVQFDEAANGFKKDGMDAVEFFISTNPGEPLKPIAKVASGGELSRMMLALKTIFSQHQGVTSIIFDEVDTGVSGRVAQAIAEKIHQVASHSQVLCISHLPQVAAMADTHLLIQKNIASGRTTTSVTPLDNDTKIKEIGRMISGVEITDLTKKHAQELLELAHSMKQT
ncbi:DNA repair protein RecN [Falsibacillus pallidus]|uniref:DNA repair protein RecN n=1 Tax=Falsibacillus pallidus TaxID=493781 RepID=A0A370GH12_9BACI|nr:DNA repair protein RecN [Falsibacillus pallidus]RDI41203.1 DNA replication and repair protein RecN [Falsibacillus pallidus]